MAKLERWGSNSYKYTTRSSNAVILTIDEWQDLLEALSMELGQNAMPIEKEVKETKS